MLVIGLTGSIGMGKSTTAKLFEEQGLAVFDSDLCVHQLYAADGAATEIFRLNPSLRKTVKKDNKGRFFVDRTKLKEMFFKDLSLKKQVEEIVHGLVRASQSAFIAEARRAGYKAVVLDIPLLYEVGAEKRCDVVCVVTAPKSVQKKRVMARDGMTQERFNHILKSQITDAEKRRRADFIINTGLGIAKARQQVKAVLQDLKL
ncbi:MAG: dephospho-CoA kinase [Micavibrio sp.]|nr:dephospho-CoA kinase [Micavibrio sp.]|tara:strand:+ start:4084 stop:4692 length:609 start_codon:yes stop_codon:yes gene_type:complete